MGFIELCWVFVYIILFLILVVIVWFVVLTSLAEGRKKRAVTIKNIRYKQLNEPIRVKLNCSDRYDGLGED